MFRVVATLATVPMSSVTEASGASSSGYAGPPVGGRTPSATPFAPATTACADAVPP